MRAIIQGVKVAEVKKGVFENEKTGDKFNYQNLMQDCEVVEAKWKISDDIINKMIDGKVKKGEVLDLIVDLKYNNKTGGFVFKEVVAFNRAKGE